MKTDILWALRKIKHPVSNSADPQINSSDWKGRLIRLTEVYK